MTSALSSYLAILRRGWRLLLWGVIGTVGALTVVLLVAPPQYESAATVFVRTPGDVSSVVDGGDSYAQARARTYAAMAGSTDLARQVADIVHTDADATELADGIRADNRAGTALIDVAVTSSSAAGARETAEAFLGVFARRIAALEAVPGALVPRAEIVVVDSPGPARRVVAGGIPVGYLIVVAVAAGLLIGALGAVIRSLRSPRPAQTGGEQK